MVIQRSEKGGGGIGLGMQLCGNHAGLPSPNHLAGATARGPRRHRHRDSARKIQVADQWETPRHCIVVQDKPTNGQSQITAHHAHPHRGSVDRSHFSAMHAVPENVLLRSGVCGWEGKSSRETLGMSRILGARRNV
jgi:hypothetical protein